ncbi:hypothetical protein Bhyg_00859, partial [Pseudolycoriella hygida]
ICLRNFVKIFKKFVNFREVDEKNRCAFRRNDQIQRCLWKTISIYFLGKTSPMKIGLTSEKNSVLL